jgi:Ala-tRNA(Pro) deacylase
MIVPRLQQYLAEHHTSYQHTIHRNAFTARAAAHEDHVPTRAMAKTVVFVADGYFGMAVLPANTSVDLHELKEALGVGRIRLATEEEMVLLFPDVEVGAMAPFGNLYAIPVYVDERLASQPAIAFNAGTHRDLVHMRYRDFERLVEPLVVHFARKC